MQVKARGAVFEENTSEQGNLKKLALGRLDAVMVMSNPLTGVDHWAREAGVADRVRLAFKSASSEEGFFGASVKHPDGLRVLAQYNAGIKAITANGLIHQIKDRWASAK
jgi:ABC-type amino acid transport substrate-binding protein